MHQNLSKYIPLKLKERKQWIILTKESNANNNPVANQQLDDLHHLDLFTFEEASKIVGIHFLNKLRFVVTKDDPFVFVIIKSSLDSQGDLNSHTLEIVDQINSYTEYQNNEDILIICEAILPVNKQTRKSLNGIELMDSGILSLSGDAMYGKEEILENTKGVVHIYNNYFSAKTSSIANPTPSYKEIVNQLRNMEQGKKLLDLFNGNWKPYYSSQIEADLSLCKSLAIATNQNKKLMDETYRHSKLFRNDWDHEYYQNSVSYGEETINKACNTINSKNNENRYFLEPANTEPPWYQSGERGKLTFIPPILAEHISNQFNLLYCNEKYYRYQSGLYKEKSLQEIKSIIQRHLYKTYAKSSQIRETEDFLKIMLHKPDCILNGDETDPIINFKNGLLNVDTKKFSTHTPRHYTSIQMNCFYSPASEAPLFLTYLSQVLDESAISLAQEFLGYLLIANTKAQKAFLLYGPGRSGKSTFLQIIEMIIGQSNISNIAWHDLEDKFQPATLFGKLVNLFGDLPASSLKDTSNFKALTGGDTINAQFKNGQIFSFRNKARLVFSCNQLPANNVDRTDAFYRRIVLIPFSNKISENKVDPNLIDKLKKEKDAIVAWALQGLYRLMKNNYSFTPNVMAEKILEQYKTNNDSVLWFIKNYCDLNLDVRCYSQELYHAYKNHSKINGLQAKTQPQFNDDILRYSKGSVLKDKEGKTKKAIYRGISLIN